MKAKLWLPGILFSVFFLASAAFYSSHSSSFQTSADWEIFLNNAEIVSAIPDENAGRTEPWRIALDNGEIQKTGWFKHLNRNRPHPLADSYRYELAAYALNRLLGLELVPPTVERVINGVRGSLQLFCDHCYILKDMKRKNIEISREEDFERNMLDVTVFENLTYCRSDDQDVLVDPETAKLFRVDFSQAFAPEYRLFEKHRITCCSAKLQKALKNLHDDEIAQALKDYLNPEELEALLDRKRRVLTELGRDE